MEDPSLWFESIMFFITQVMATIAEMEIED